MKYVHIYIYQHRFCSPRVISFLGLILVWRIEEISPTLLLPVYSASLLAGVYQQISTLYATWVNTSWMVWDTLRKRTIIWSCPWMMTLWTKKSWDPWNVFGDGDSCRTFPKKRLGWFIQQEHKQGKLDLHLKLYNCNRDDPYHSISMHALDPSFAWCARQGWEFAAQVQVKILPYFAELKSVLREVSGFHQSSHFEVS